MSGWIWRGLRGGILTTKYPRGADTMPEQYRGIVIARDAEPEEQQRGAAICPTDAILPNTSRARIDRLRCVQCGLCTQTAPAAFTMESGFQLASLNNSAIDTVQTRIRAVSKTLGRSVHLRHVDAGSDGSEEQELQAIFNPFYDAHRLGIFLTPTPRHADVLVVTGGVTKPMEQPLLRTHAAMPEPKIVVALGTTACSGSVFAQSTALCGPVDSILPVDVYVPGAPPAPLTILHGLLLALGRLPRLQVPS